MTSRGHFNDQIGYLPAFDPLCHVLHGADSNCCGILSQAMLLPDSEHCSGSQLTKSTCSRDPLAPAVLGSCTPFLHSFPAAWSSLPFCKHTRILLPQDLGTGCFLYMETLPSVIHVANPSLPSGLDSAVMFPESLP